ncbi:MAG: ABC transporter substrate-binding protein [Actinomycetota bacterium]|nr:ABC transporter substrate-binding protein [Actinomycetota bacterium]
MQHIRLMTWCSSCVSGMHLPAFAAAEGGLFAEHGLDVEFVPAAKFKDFSLSGFTTRIKAVATGDADFALTAAVYLVAAQTEAASRLPVRFVAAAHQRNPIVGVVRGDSDLRTPEDLAGARAARWSIPWFTQEYAGALDYMGLQAPQIVDVPGDLDQALDSGEIDVIPTWMDMTLYHLDAGFGVRAIPLDIPVYTTGLVVADRVPSDVVGRMREAFAAGHELQRRQPELGLAGFRRCFPNVSEEHARANWALYAPYAFDGASPGTMDPDRWRETLTHVAKTHGLGTFPGEQIYRPESVACRPERIAA